MPGPNWKIRKTKNGYNADEVISALQKDIRRGNTDNAVFWSYELLISGKIYQDKFWERVTTIAVEDVGLGNPYAVTLILNLKNIFFTAEFDKEDDRFIQGLFAAAYLAESTKDRYIDEIKTSLKLYWKKRPMPDYAIDKHTKAGKALGRGDLHFWLTGAFLNNERKNRNKKYLEEILKHLKNSSNEKAL